MKKLNQSALHLCVCLNEKPETHYIYNVTIVTSGSTNGASTFQKKRQRLNLLYAKTACNATNCMYMHVPIHVHA